MVENAARLCALLVEPHAKGQGLGKLLVQRCITFARDHGYKSLVHSTQSNPTPTRRLYEAAGFKMLHEEEARDFVPLNS